MRMRDYCPHQTTTVLHSEPAFVLDMLLPLCVGDVHTKSPNMGVLASDGNEVIQLAIEKPP
jgi:hypothetical protein